ncbi:MAG: hypothetical protein ACE5LU_00165 [Anaerolineae bacterium]
MPEHLGAAARQLLLNLYNKGPAMPVELAAQCYSFPDEVAPTLKSLGEAGLLEIRPVAGSQFGGSLVYLSDLGRYRVRHDLLGGGS